MDQMVKLQINDIPVEVPAGTTILKAAEKVGVKIPRLCYHPDLKPWAACGLCIVRELVKDRKDPTKWVASPKLLRSCCTAVAPDMRIVTHDPEIVAVRRTVLELILSAHPNDCLQCPRNGTCELQKIAADFGIREIPFKRRVRDLPVDASTPSIVLDPRKCIQCGRCVQVCQDMQNVWALEFLYRGERIRMAPAGDIPLADSPCIKCGQCSAHCPVGAIYAHDDTGLVWDALRDAKKYCVVQIAPAVRVAVGEAFDMAPGAVSTGKIYTALRRMGFKAVFDTNWSADLTIMEEGTEFVRRFTKAKGAGPLPLITSCCPSWTDWMEKYAPDFTKNFSTAKSPHEMLGVMAKTYYAQKMKIDPADIYVVSIMPCTSKKYEISRDKTMSVSGHPDVDVVLTTREFANMVKSVGIDFANLPDSKADSILGEYSGAGTIFGVTGGVMEAALRTAYHLITKKELAGNAVEFHDIRGLDGVKEADVNVDGTIVHIAVAHQMGNVEKVINKVREARKAGKPSPYDFIEVMACRGGCVGGGGQPRGATDELRRQRAAGLYTDDERSVHRCSHLNPEIQRVYKEFLVGGPGGKEAEHLLHTHYEQKKVYQK